MTSYMVTAYTCKHAIASLSQLYGVLLVAMAALAGFAGVFCPVPQNISSPKEGVSFSCGGGLQTCQTRKPGTTVLVDVRGTFSPRYQPA